jgi:hypothetical protein
VFSILSFRYIIAHKSKPVEDFGVSEVIVLKMSDRWSADDSALWDECTVLERVIFDSFSR